MAIFAHILDQSYPPSDLGRKGPRRGFAFPAPMAGSDKPLFAMAFFDVQNLYQHVKAAFGHSHPNFDPQNLHRAVCEAHGWTANLVRFYTGVPDATVDPMWARYWNSRIITLKRANVNVTTRKLRYRKEIVRLETGEEKKVLVAQEKGIDIRIALDLTKFVRKGNFDVAVLFSQDQDLAEVVDEVKEIAKEQGRTIKICCAFPSSHDATSRRGVDRTDWFKMDEDFYNKCLDPKDYRPKK